MLEIIGLNSPGAAGENNALLRLQSRTYRAIARLTSQTGT